ERQLGVARRVPVDKDHASREVAYEALLLVYVVRPDVGAEAELGPIREVDRLLEATNTVESRDRSEHFLLMHPHRRGDFCENGRGVVEAGSLERFAAAEHLGTERYRVVDELCHVVDLLRGGEGSD